MSHACRILFGKYALGTRKIVARYAKHNLFGWLYNLSNVSSLSEAVI